MNCRVIRGEMSMRCGKKCVVIAGAELEAAVGDGVNRLPFTSGHHPCLQPSHAQQQNIISTSSKSYLSAGIGFDTLREARKDTCEFSVQGEGSHSPCPGSRPQHLRAPEQAALKTTCSNGSSLLRTGNNSSLQDHTHTQRCTLPKWRAARLD